MANPPPLLFIIQKIPLFLGADRPRLFILWGNLPLTFFFWGIPLYLGAFWPSSLLFPLEKPSPLSSSLLFPLGILPFQLRKLPIGLDSFPSFSYGGILSLDFIWLSLLSSFRPTAFTLVCGRSEEIVDQIDIRLGFCLPPYLYAVGKPSPLSSSLLYPVWRMFLFKSRKFSIGTEGMSRLIGSELSLFPWIRGAGGNLPKGREALSGLSLIRDRRSDRDLL